MIIPISPLSTAKITSKKYNTNTTQLNQTLPQSKYDSVELSFTAVKIANPTTGKKTKTKNISTQDKLDKALQDSAKEIKSTADYAQKKAKELSQSTRHTIDETLKEFESIEPLKDGTKVIEKYSDDGKTLLSRAVFIERNKNLFVENYADKTKMSICNGDLREFYTGCEFIDDEVAKADEYFHIAFGRLFIYDKGIESFGNNTKVMKKIKEGLTFYNSTNDFVYVKNWQFDPDDKETKEEEIVRFRNGKISKWEKNF